LESLTDCTVVIEGRLLVLSTSDAVATPTLRLITGGRASAVVTGKPRSDSSFEFGLPSDLTSDLKGSIGLELVPARSVPNECSPSLAVAFDSLNMSTRSRPTRLNDLDYLVEGRLDDLANTIAEAAATTAHARVAVEELFEDERAGAATLLRLRETGSQKNFELALIACLPAAFLVSSLGVDPQLVSDHRLGFAVLGPRSPRAWAALGWPNGQTFYSGATWTDLAGFVQRLAPREPLTTATFRYSSNSGPRSPKRVSHVVSHLEGKHVDAEYLDLVVAAQRLIMVDQLADESMRMLLEAYLCHPRATKDAIIAGIAVTLACES